MSSCKLLIVVTISSELRHHAHFNTSQSIHVITFSFWKSSFKVKNFFTESHCFSCQTNFKETTKKTRELHLCFGNLFLQNDVPKWKKQCQRNLKNNVLNPSKKLRILSYLSTIKMIFKESCGVFFMNKFYL